MNKFTLSLIIVWIGFSSCSKNITGYTGIQAFHSKDGKPEYDDINYWAAHPAKKDMSDTVPFKITNHAFEGVDVFFVHPTTFTTEQFNANNAAIDDSVINYKTDHSSILYQASVFNENNRVYAPRYRQAHISMYQEKDSLLKYGAFDLAYQDVKSAFGYYLKNDNQGRPFIIASHSQGTNHAERLIKEMIDGKELQEKLVCAYLIGMPIMKTSFKHIKPCNDSSETGCVVSWRTYDEKYVGTWVNREDSSIIVTNPLSWELDTFMVEKEKALGAVLYNMNKIYPYTHHAQILGNALWINKPKFPGSFLYRNKNYHAGDINLFYQNIRINVAGRINAYYKKENHH